MGGGGKAWPAPEADNLTAIIEPIVKKMWDPRRVSQSYLPSWPVTRVSLLSYSPCNGPFSANLFRMKHFRGYRQFIEESA
jgi:hypothetical protein